MSINFASKLRPKLLVDFSALAVAAFAKGSALDRDEPMSETATRHMILQSLAKVVGQQSAAFPEIYLCCDWPKGSWRLDKFPHYKAGRSPDPKMDWDMYRSVRNELIEFLSDVRLFRTLLVDRAEADDVIAAIVTRSPGHRIRIVSGDKDFRQLWSPTVDQWNPREGKVMEPDDGLTPDQFLRVLTLKGDRGDGIPNFMSPDDAFVRPGFRSPSVFAKKTDAWAAMTPEQFKTEVDGWPIDWKRGFARNVRLINLRRFVPVEIHDRVTELMAPRQDPDKATELGKLREYCLKHQLFQIHDRLSDFGGAHDPKAVKRRSFEDMF